VSEFAYCRGRLIHNSRRLLAAKPAPALPGNFPTGRVILTVGRWCGDERYKGMDTLITALPRLLMEWRMCSLWRWGKR